MNASKIRLDYDPQYQGLITLAAYGFLACFAIFAVQFFLLATNTGWYAAGGHGDWDQLLRIINGSPTTFILIQSGFIALRTIYSITIIGYLVPVWNVHKSAAVVMLAVTALSLPIIVTCHVFELALVPLARDYVAAAANSAAATGYLTSAQMVYTTAELGDTYVNLVPFIVLLVAWAVITWRKPLPRYLSIWLVVLAILPFGSRLLSLPILGLVNAALTGVLFLIIWRQMLRFESSRQQ